MGKNDPNIFQWLAAFSISTLQTTKTAKKKCSDCAIEMRQSIIFYTPQSVIDTVDISYEGKQELLALDMHS